MFLVHLDYDGVFLLPALVFLISKCGGVSLVGMIAERHDVKPLLTFHFLHERNKHTDACSISNRL